MNAFYLPSAHNASVSFQFRYLTLQFYKTLYTRGDNVTIHLSLIKLHILNSNCNINLAK